MATQIQLRRDTAANWTSTNPILAQGEIGIETDTAHLKVGDGSTAWSSLGYLGLADGTVTTGMIADGAVTLAKWASGILDTDGTLAADSDTRVPSQKAVKTYADQLIAAADAMVFKGVIDCSANPNYPAANRGDTYRVSVAGKIGGASGVNVEAGDILICLTDGTSSGNQATVGSSWTIVQTNLDGAVIGPTSATSGNLASFNGTSGKLIQDAGIALDIDGTLAANSDGKVPSQKAVKTALAAKALAAPVIFTSSGTWTPSTTGLGIFMATLVGGGGGGCSVSSSASGAGGAGGEILGEFYLGNVTGAQTVTIGAGGTGGAAGGNDGAKGGNTSIGSLATASGGYGSAVATSTLRAPPGSGRNIPDNNGVNLPGSGGVSVTGAISASVGGGYQYQRFGCGGGGGGGPTSGAGGISGNIVVGASGGTGAALGGGGGASGGVAGGNGSAGVGGNGSNGAANTGNGGGGAGAGTTTGAGGNGGSGYVIIYQVA